MKRLALTIIFFFLTVFIAGGAMISFSWAIKGSEVFWVVKQATPPTILLVVLALGVWSYDKTRLSNRYVGNYPEFGIKGLFLSATLGAVLFVGSLILQYFLTGTIQNNSAYYTLPFERFWPSAVIALAFTGVGQPIVEELIFRGRVFDAAKSSLSTSTSIGLVSILFAALHSQHFFPTFIFSVVLCLMRIRHGLRMCIFTHIFFNVMSILLDMF